MPVRGTTKVLWTIDRPDLKVAAQCTRLNLNLMKKFSLLLTAVLIGFLAAPLQAGTEVYKQVAPPPPPELLRKIIRIYLASETLSLSIPKMMSAFSAASNSVTSFSQA